MSFWWEGIPKEVKQLFAACHDSQMRRKTKIIYRAPIEEKSSGLESARKELENSQLEFNDLKHGELNQKMEDIQSNKENLQKGLTSETEKNQLLKVSVQTLEKEINSLNQEVFKMFEEVRKSESSKLELEKKASKLTDELKVSQNNCQQHSSRLEELEKENTVFKLEIQELLKNKENLSKSSPQVIAVEKRIKNEFIWHFKEVEGRNQRI